MKLRQTLQWPKEQFHRSALRRYAVPSCLWSKGYSRFCDCRGPARYWVADTESCQSEAFFRRHYRNAHGLVWIRLGSRSKNGHTCDLDNFVRGALQTIAAPFGLITTDGDTLVPSELPRNTVEQLLDCRFLISWHTQNFDGRHHPKFGRLPIGIDLHTPKPRLGPAKMLSQLQRISGDRMPPNRMPLRVFCDLGTSPISDDRRSAVAALEDCDHVDFLTSRIPQGEIWQHYSQYPFVLSAQGNGLDSHRTWELLYLGCIVITKRSALDPLFEGLAVVTVDDWNEVREISKLAEWVRAYAPLAEPKRVWHRLQTQKYLQPIRDAIRDLRLSDLGRTLPRQSSD